MNAHTDCTHLHACTPAHRHVKVKKIYISSKVYDETKWHLNSSFHANIWAIFECDNTKTINLYYVHLKKTQAGGQKKCRPLLKTFFICISYLFDNMFVSWLCILLMCNIWGGGAFVFSTAAKGLKIGRVVLFSVKNRYKIIRKEKNTLKNMLTTVFQTWSCRKI